MAARNRKGLSEATRSRIQTTMIVKRLEKHILAKPEKIDGEYVVKDLMTQSQVSAALGLIKKTLPDLSAVELSGEVIHKDANELSDSELANIAAGSSTGTVEQTDSSQELH
ncbi:MAG: hypothetical protein V3T88_07895 [Nitrosomonadaceae bacterium]